MVRNKHLFNIIGENYWPIYFAIGLFHILSGISFTMHYIENSKNLLICGIILLISVGLFWIWELIKESVYKGWHTRIVRNSLMKGFLLFLVSEIMLFFGFFWAFFHSALSPSIELGGVWPPYGLYTIPVYEYPLLNTCLLITSGFSVTWVHRGIASGSYKETIDGFLITIILGLIFVYFQVKEYYDATYNLQDGIYASSFYMLTGLHGCHVIVGVIFLIIALISLLVNHYTTTHYLRLVFAIWYWHFVDIVWIVLFLSLYCWGSW